MNKQKYSNNISIKKGRLRSNKTNNKVQYKNIQQQYCKQPVYIDRDFAKAEHSPSSAFIRLCTLRYKRQDRVGNGVSERIHSVLCEDMLCEKRIIVVRRFLL